ncbi:1-(5-phosphoribosyl)-5-[(5-phosphoribosylamino)methylideneamino]imidazole-4-carboxamide isomerase [Dielma fastidiosa]|uniref:1-(5-phosphoribosyl)-5-[(5-phosphoribosylamino)methylideneamino] imidazole-4-carboxamide isomerase n=1 Tax=Dielma fastidiosa TaxID=1034346 RepID=A0A318KLH4_9FIRM|nr:1-(5-phosphoribosyl)-5-[(5-phosphoribosylamino)methylideneamino]imidazole-4-carboxamide isomerase [Dielma fastidiosa]PXX78904.1 1-(5-phosphoribosyl)-5-[(5-phosphoribosylamino)methylideneamino] imidazole-4-carboxamide isomerase [Dielma fastidiosa]
MICIPAIDLLDGQAVRLFQGDYEKGEAVGEVDSILKRLNHAKAQLLHVVDLNGAKCGQRVNEALIAKIVQKAEMPVEVGGGIRTMEAIEAYLNCGVKRVILGTAALEDETFLKAALARYGDQIAVGVDCKDGFVCVRGWLSESQVNYIEFAKHLEALGVLTLIVTDIKTDGTLQGPNLTMLKALRSQVSLQIIASGGIRDLQNLRDLKAIGMDGAIMGKAIYANTIDLEAAVKLCREA